MLNKNMSDDNKYTFFVVAIELPTKYKESPHLKNELNDSIDMILYQMGAANKDSQNYQLVNEDKIVQIFRCKSRKRKGQLNKFCRRHLPEDVIYESKGIDKDELTALVAHAKKKNYIIKKEVEIDENEYDGRDIQIFKDSKNWYEWQTEIYNMIFDKKGNIKEPDLRQITSIVDFEGNSGKTSYFKYLYILNKNDIGRLTYGTASQLRSAVVGLGKKKIYIIDLARTKAKEDSQQDLLSVIEDIKSGMVFAAMYGQAKELIMEPPHVIVSSNYLLNTESLSSDRWQVFEILKNKKLGKKNTLIRKEKIKK